ncbi:hypothetical protein AMTR_s00069p00093200 [Amborella trichopoda]|uniref:Uncharacterized protein n=1 Tax=Amborella trichopoda TaxID=13333 RepID=U5DAS4_AMBTC|nr:hypothetical protein AMTR_s00069p00093200 [Amborella trichopoda]
MFINLPRGPCPCPIRAHVPCTRLSTSRGAGKAYHCPRWCHRCAGLAPRCTTHIPHGRPIGERICPCVSTRLDQVETLDVMHCGGGCGAHHPSGHEA